MIMYKIQDSTYIGFVVIVNVHCALNLKGVCVKRRNCMNLWLDLLVTDLKSEILLYLAVKVLAVCGKGK